MAESLSGIRFTNVVNVQHQQQFSVTAKPLANISQDKDGSSENRIDTVTAANDLLKNGILVETTKGLVCMSLKDALTTGLGGFNLSVEDLQNVAAQLLTQQTPVTDTSTSPPLTLGNVTFNVIPDASQGRRKQVGSGTEDNPKAQPLEVKVALDVDKTATQVCDKSKHVRPATESDATSKAATTAESSGSDSATPSNKPKRKGGWPKGRKRKPEPKNQPPKAPATGYVLFLNERRRQHKDLPFSEVTKLLGNCWSKMSVEEKQIYLYRASVDRKRYRVELQAYKQSDTYQAYINSKRNKDMAENGTEESDVDADVMENGDNEELYCRTCDQWFTSFHNRTEHFYGRQHLQAIAGDMTKERPAEQDPGSRVASPDRDASHRSDPESLPEPSNMADAITSFMLIFKEREREMALLQGRLAEHRVTNQARVQELGRLRCDEQTTREALEAERKTGAELQKQLFNIWAVPLLFLSSVAPRLKPRPS